MIYSFMIDGMINADDINSALELLESAIGDIVQSPHITVRGQDVIVSVCGKNSV